MASPPKVPDPFDDPMVSRISDRSWRSSASGEREPIPASSIWSRGTIAQSSPQGRTYDDDFISTRTLLVGGVDTQPGQAREFHGNFDDPFSFGYPIPNQSRVLQDQYANTQLFLVGEPPHGSNTQFYLRSPLARATRTMGDIQRYPVGQPYDPFHGTSFAGDTFEYGDPCHSTSFAGDTLQYGGSRARQFVVEPPRPAVPHSFYGPFTNMFQPCTNIQPYPVGETNRSAIPHSFYSPLTGTIQTYANVQQHPIGENGDRSSDPPHVRGALQMNGANAQSYAIFKPHRSAVPPTTYNPHSHNKPSFESFQQYLVGEPHDPLFNPSFAGGSLRARGALAPPFSQFYPYKYGDPLATQSAENTQTHPVREAQAFGGGSLQARGALAPPLSQFYPHEYGDALAKQSAENTQTHPVREAHAFGGGSLQARGALAPPLSQFYPHEYGETLATQSAENTQTHPVREARGSVPTVFDNPNLNCLQTMGNIQRCPTSSQQGFRAKEWKNKNPKSSSLIECDKNRITSKGKVTFQEEILTPLGTRCSLCNIDLAFERDGSSDGRNHPITAVMSCGHCYHVDCLELIGCPMQTCDDPPCVFCFST